MRIASLLVLVVFIAGCSSVQQPVEEPVNSSRDCPDPSVLSYDNDSDTYVEWRNCMPSPGRSAGCDEVDEDYVDWVNENCGFNYSVRVAY